MGQSQKKSKGEKGGEKKPIEKKEKEKPSGGKAPHESAQMRAKRDENVRGIVRVCNKDLDGYTPLSKAMWKIKGVGTTLSSVLAEAAADKLHIPDNTPVGLLTEEQIRELEEVVFHPEKYGVPEFMLNRQRDPVEGDSKHLIGNDIEIALRSDKQRLMTMKSWRGMRHQTRKGKVRGQSTRSTGRGKTAVGVIRKTLRAKLGAPAAAGGAAAPAAPAAGKPAAKTSAKPAEKKK